ncbi:MAG: Gfo/Idh/MocA family oxidoreductase [Bacteroidetes bacterium]|nr:Gfo/Idh/MocA family oxidoreductase [Bacteroidota bacterium]
MKKYMAIGVSLLLLLSSCTKKDAANMFTPLEGKVKLMNLDPGHFHAALVQKTMYESVAPEVYVYAPEGPEVESYLKRIEDYNTREENPSSWEEKLYTGDDFLEKMLGDKPGNVMVVSGNNAKKTEYILKSVRNGIHVLADKPMVISPDKFSMLEEAFATASEKGVLLYDIMTERHEITTILQKEFSQLPEVFGEMQVGSPNLPAITKESVHHFSKIVSGKPLIRPPWFFDTEQQGEGIVDVCTHLVDLVQWEAFPEVVLKKEDVQIISSKRWTTALTTEMFKKVTGLDSYPSYLEKDVEGSILRVYSNGEINYTLKGVHARVSVIWNFQAPEGTGDTHNSTMRGSNCELMIRQGEAEGYKPTLYIMPTFIESPDEFRKALEIGTQQLAVKYPGLDIEMIDELLWRVNIPDSYKVGHEAHFGQVTEKFLDYLSKGTLPEWEIPNMIVKYYTTTEGLKQAFDMK